MSKKGLKPVANKPEEHSSPFPDWYWRHGLHDAEILSISELEFTPNWKSKNPRRNCLEIHLDSHNALFENKITGIRLYNYKIETSELDFNNSEKCWWMWDTLKQLPNNCFLLEICIEGRKRPDKWLIVKFGSAEIERE